MESSRPCPPRERAVIELITTEEMYLSELSNLIECFKVPLTSWIEKLRLTARTSVSGLPVNPILQDPSLINSLFSNIDAIFSFNTGFLRNLRSCFDAETGRYAVAKIANTVASQAPSLRIYSIYVSNFDRAQQLVNILKKDPLAEIFIEALELNGRCHNLDFLSFLIQPVQRIPRYRLLLNEILKWSEKAIERQTSKSYRNLGLAIIRPSTGAGVASDDLVEELTREIADIRVALDVVCQIAQSVNDAVAHHEKKLRVSEVCRQFSLPTSFFPANLDRFVLCEFECLAIYKEKSKKVKLVLMSDIIMYGSEQSASKKTYKNKVSVYLSSCICLNADISTLSQQLAVTDADVDDVQIVVIFSDMKIVTFIFSSPANKSDFTEALSKLQRRDEGSFFADDGSIVAATSRRSSDQDDEGDSVQDAFGLPQFKLTNVSSQSNLFDLFVFVYFNRRRLQRVGVRLVAGMNWKSTSGTLLSSLLIPLTAAGKKGGMLSRWTSSATDADTNSTTVAALASDVLLDVNSDGPVSSSVGRRKDLPRAQTVADSEKKKREDQETAMKRQLKCVTMLQSLFRCHVEMKKFSKIKNAVCVIQAILRMKICKGIARRRMRAVRVIQRLARLCRANFMIADVLLDRLLKVKLEMSNGLELMRFFRTRGGFFSLFSMNIKYYMVPIYLDTDEERIIWDDSSDSLDDAEAASGIGGGLCAGRIDLTKIIGFYIDPADAASAVLNSVSGRQKDQTDIDIADHCFEMMNAMNESRRLAIVIERRNRMSSSDGIVKRLFLTVEASNLEQRKDIVRCLSVLSFERGRNDVDNPAWPFIDQQCGVTQRFLNKFWAIAKQRIIMHADQIVSYVQSSSAPRQQLNQKPSSRLFKKQSSKTLTKQKSYQVGSKAAGVPRIEEKSDRQEQTVVKMNLSISSIQMLKVPAAKVKKNPQATSSIQFI